MSFIDATYFVGDLNIPNSGSPEIGEAITSYIQKYEPMFLRKLLGYPLFKAFEATLSDTIPPTSTDPRITSIITGTEYTDLDGNLAYWKGLLVTEPEANDALNDCVIAYWVYYWYNRNLTTQTAAIGEVRTVPENATLVTPRQKLISALNVVHMWAYEFLAYMKTNEVNDPTLYPEWTYRNRWEAAKSFAFVNPIF